MGKHVAQTADTGDLAAPRDSARERRRALAASRRRALADQSAPAETPVAINGVAAARLGRALSMQRRRQVSQGKQALNGGGDRTPAEAGAEARAFIVYRGGAS